MSTMSTNSFIALPMVILLALLVCGIPLLIGVYVYRDAERRGMSGLLWALVAVFVPSLIGLIIYLLVRGNYSELKCPGCHAPVKEEYTVCPRCGAKLRPSCPNCSAPVEPDWKVCPRCAQPLPEVENDVVPPVRPKDRTLGKVLLVIILIPVLLIALAIFILTAVTSSNVANGGPASLGQISFDSYFEKQEDSEIREAVEKWIDSFAGNTEHAYALMYEEAGEDGNTYYALVYIPGAGDSSSIGFGQSNGLWGTTLRLELEHTGNNGSLYCVKSSAKRAPDLKITVDGQKIKCDITMVDFNPVIVE